MVRDMSFFEWMAGLMGNFGHNIGDCSELLRMAGILPQDSDDLLMTMRAVMHIGYYHDKPALVAELADKMPHMSYEFHPNNKVGPVAPTNVYSLETAVRIKRAFVGPAHGPDGQPFTLTAEMETFMNISELDEAYPTPSAPKDAAILPPSASRPLDGLLRVICPDIARIIADNERATKHLAATVAPEEHGLLEMCLASRSASLLPWKEYIKKTYARIFGSGRDHHTPHARYRIAMSEIARFTAQFQPFTPGMGSLSHIVAHLHEQQQQHMGPFAVIKVPYEDAVDDGKFMDLGLRTFADFCARFAITHNNRRNTHVIAVCLASVFAANHCSPAGAMTVSQAMAILLGPSGLGKTHLLMAIKNLLPEGVAEWIGRETESVGHGNGDSFGGVTFKDEVPCTSCGVQTESCTDYAIIRAANTDGGFADELVDSRQWNLAKQRSATGSSTIVTTIINSDGVRQDLKVATTDIRSTLMSANIPYFAFGATAATRIHRMHMGNSTQDVLGHKETGGNEHELQEEFQNIFAVHTLVTWMINVGMLPPMNTVVVDDLRMALENQLRHEMPETSGWSFPRAYGRVRMACQSITVLGAVTAMCVSGAGRDHKGRLALEYMIPEISPMLICSLSTFIFCAELYGLAGPQLLIDVVTALRDHLGLRYDESTGLCERDPTYWGDDGEHKLADHKKPVGDLTFDGLYAVRSGYIALDSGRGAVAQGGQHAAGPRVDNRVEQNRLIMRLAKDLQSRLGERYPVQDISCALHSLTRNIVRNRMPGIDIDREHKTGAQSHMAVPGLKITTRGPECHQRMFFVFRRDFFRDTMDAIIPLSTADATEARRGIKSVRPYPDPSGRFPVVIWGKKEPNAAPSLSDDKRLQADIVRAEANLKKAIARREEARKNKPMFIQNKLVQELQQMQADIDAARKWRLLLNEAPRALAAGVSYSAWKDVVGAGASASAPKRIDWVQRELRERRKFIAAATVTPYNEHWTTRLPSLVSSYGKIVDSAARLCEFVQSMAHDSSEQEFMMQLDHATDSVVNHVRAVQSMSSSLRGLSITFARRLWESQIGHIIRIPALLYMITGDAGHTFQLKELAQMVFRLYRSIAHAKYEWQRLRDMYNTLAMMNGKHTLHVLYDPNHEATRKEFEDTERFAKDIGVAMRECVFRINSIAAEIQADPITYPLAQKLLEPIDCCDELAQAVLRPLPPSPGEITMLIRAILDAAEIPDRPPLPSAMIQNIRVTGGAGVPAPSRVERSSSSNSMETDFGLTLPPAALTTARIRAIRANRQEAPETRPVRSVNTTSSRSGESDDGGGESDLDDQDAMIKRFQDMQPVPESEEMEAEGSDE